MESYSQHLIPGLKSSFLTTCILSYTYRLNDALATIRILNKNGVNFIEKNQKQLQSFCVSPNIREITLNLSQNCFKRYQPHRIVEKLTFVRTNSDLYKLEEFAKKSLGFGTVMFGNEDFSLEVKEDKAITQKNHEVLFGLIKKAKTLQLNRIDLTHEVLNLIYQHPDQFENLQGLFVDLFKDYIDPVIQVLKKLNLITELGLNQPYYDKDVAIWEKTAIQIVRQMVGLQKLSLLPANDSAMVILNECKDNLQELQELQVSLSTTQDEIMSHYQTFKSMKNLKKLHIINGIVNQEVIGALPQIQELIVSTGFKANKKFRVMDFHNLTKLTIEIVEKTACANLYEVLSELPNLRELTVDYPLTQENHPLENLLRKNKSLTYLKVIKFRPSNFDFMVGLGENTTLRTLILEMHRVREERLSKKDDPLFNGLKNTTLEHFSIKGSAKAKFKYHLGPQYFASLLTMLENLTFLQMLNLQFGIHDAELLTEPIRSKQCLNQLIFNSCQFNMQAQKLLLEGIQDMKLKALSFVKCDFQDDELGLIIKMIDNNKFLRKIELDFCDAKFEDTLIPLLTSVGKHQSMKFLSIMHSKLRYNTNDESLKLLQESILSNCQNLEYLHLEDLSNKINSPFKEDILRDLYEKMSGLQELKF